VTDTTAILPAELVDQAASVLERLAELLEVADLDRELIARVAGTRPARAELAAGELFGEPPGPLELADRLTRLALRLRALVPASHPAGHARGCWARSLAGGPCTCRDWGAAW
jgi:hypothetical protein